MSPSEDANDEVAGAAPPEARFAIQKIYVKDISYESPHAPDIFTTEWKPNVDLQMQNSARKIGGDNYEIVVSVTVTVTVGEQTAFLVEIVQAGIFLISGFDEESLKMLLGSSCPSILFPYVRENVSDLVTRGGFPQLLLAPVNFEVLYQRHVEQQALPVGEAEP